MTYNTNLAAEFYVLHVLHRLCADANLTLGNKKAVDIVVVRGAGDTVTVDVKGLAGKTSWPVDKVTAKDRHFLVFVGFAGKIDDPSAVPECYIVPSARLAALTYVSPKGRKVVPLSRMRKGGKAFRDAWKLIV